MTARIHPSGRRSVQAEVDAPGTPETVWAAIATGSGISSWFVPTEVDGRVGGKTVCRFGPDGGMDSIATIAEWDPPRRFVAKSEDGPDGEGPAALATEWVVAAKAGGDCTVRVVHSWRDDGDEWDAQFESHAEGWATFFKILRFYLERYAGAETALVQLAAWSDGPVDRAFEQIAAALGAEDGAEGRPIAGAAAAPPLAGEAIEARNTPEGFSVMLRADRPAPAIAHAIGLPMGGRTYVSLRFYLYGDTAAGRAGEIEAAWRAWLDARFPAA